MKWVANRYPGAQWHVEAMASGPRAAGGRWHGTIDLLLRLATGSVVVITIATPLSQSRIGFVRGSGRTTPHLSAEVANEFCVLTFIALDDHPIASSRKLLDVER